MRTSAAIRPGRADITTTRSDSSTASAMAWVTKITDRAPSQMRSSSSAMRSRVIASSAANGSSISRISGLSASARASATRWRMPPESCAG
jgi:hypothetical protein